MYAILEKPSNLSNKIKFEQKQDVPGGLLSMWASSVDAGQKSYDLYFYMYKRDRRLLLASPVLEIYAHPLANTSVKSIKRVQIIDHCYYFVTIAFILLFLIFQHAQII